MNGRGFPEQVAREARRMIVDLPLTVRLGAFAPLPPYLDHKAAQPETGKAVFAVKPEAARLGVEIREGAEGARGEEGDLPCEVSFGSPGSFQR
jgi:hypothetical protein